MLYLLLVFLGWLNIYAAVYNEEHQNILDITQKYGRQLIWIGAAILICVIIFVIDSKFYSSFSYFIYGFIVLILMAVLIFGKEVHGARSWFEIGAIRIQPSEFAKFATALALSRYLSQENIHLDKVTPPGVIASIILPVGIIVWFRNKIAGVLLPVFIILVLPIALIFLQNDTGSALVYVAFALVLYREGLPLSYLLLTGLIAGLFIISLVFNPLNIIVGILFVAFLIYWLIRRRIKELLAGTGILFLFTCITIGINYLLDLQLKLHYLIALALFVSGIIYALWAFRYNIKHIYVLLAITLGAMIFVFSVDYVFRNIMSPHQQDRMQILLGLREDIKGAGYNVHQSKIAIGSGGLTGKGFLQGTQTKFDFVPEQSTDFIFCTIGEEWGFLGTTVVILLFVVFLFRLIFLSERQRSPFSRIYGYCVVAILFFHIAVNIGMTIGLAPVVGIPLPFFSYGGSSLWAFTILVFIFLRLDASRTEMLQ
ncbi:MAG: rod shape-determining protein RodA [Bacteroidetes bacterium]|nr:rod shape-determining protein RodA [Bacteroidota bacterium]